MTKVTVVMRSALRWPPTKNPFYEGPAHQIHHSSRASRERPSTQPLLRKCASSAWLALTVPLCSLTHSLPQLFLHPHTHTHSPLHVQVGERSRGYAAPASHGWSQGKSSSSHTECHWGHLTLHQPAEDAELQISREAPGFAPVSVLRAIKIDAENTDI